MTGVRMATSITYKPYAYCLGGLEPCEQKWPHHNQTILAVRNHIKANPGHEVIVVRETRSLYKMESPP